RVVRTKSYLFNKAPRKQENGEAVIKDNVIEMETDDNGMNVINKDELDDVLASSVVKFDDFSSQS
ncbi:hypothetical protein PAH75_001313, partial [Escherichia coli]|nr:hypothetical protein [Escherichia coli]EKJ6675460.1 hypothetical protein [Escherichia coli]EKJ6992108.1 hypothetical protein [Escherichia coli]